MITFQEIIDQLTYGELYNVSLSGDIDSNKGILEEDWPIIINHLNSALTNLHTRFNLKEREVTVQQYEEIAYYVLDTKYAESNIDSTEDPKYIMDSEENPFVDNILRINAVYDEEGCELPLNDENNCKSVFVPNYRTIQVPTPANENAMFILYRANHNKIPLNTTDFSSIEIELPSNMLELVTSYIAAKVHGMRNTETSVGIENKHYTRYEFLCRELEEQGTIANRSIMTNIKLGERGWV